MLNVKICKHSKKHKKQITAGWNNISIEIMGKDHDLLSWCSNCGAVEVWKDMETKHWLKPNYRNKL